MTHQNTLPSSDQLPQNFNRRELLVGLLASVGALSTVSCAQRLEKEISSPAMNNTESGNSLGFYTDTEFALAQRLSDLIIPTTDTLGAIEAGVPKLMDQLYSQWANASSQKQHRDAMRSIHKELNTLAGEDFLNASPSAQLSALKTLDDQAFTDNGAQKGQYRAVKNLIAKCYYATEPGATQELRYERVPGRWDPCIPFEQVGRTWAK